MNKYVLFFLAIMIIASCRDSTVIGTGLLDDEKINLDYKDDYEVHTRTVKGDSILIHASSVTDVVNLSTYLVGEVQDPIFGHYSSEIYVSFQEYLDYDFNGAEFDSLIFSMAYEPLGFIGDTLATQELSIYNLEEDYQSFDTLYSDRSFMASSTPLGTKSFKPKPNTNVEFFNPLADSTQSLTPQIRVRLDDDYGRKLMADSLLADFADEYKGLLIQSNSNGQCMMGFNLNDTNNLNNTEINSLELYYTDADGEKRVAYYVFKAATHAHFTQDYAGSSVEGFLEGTKTDSLTFVQSMNGVLTQVELPDLSSLDEDVLINHAQLVMYQASVPGDHDFNLFPASEGFYPLIINEDGTKQLIDDLISSGSEAVDGMLSTETVDGQEVGVVKFNITNYIIELANGERTNKLEITPLSRSGEAKRIIFYGSEHSKYRPVLKISFTNI